MPPKQIEIQQEKCDLCIHKDICNYKDARAIIQKKLPNEDECNGFKTYLRYCNHMSSSNIV